MPILWNSPLILDSYDVSFSYRQTSRYSEEAALFLPPEVVLYPLASAPPRRHTAAMGNSTVQRLLSRTKRVATEGWDLLLRYPRFGLDVLRIRSVLRTVRPTVVHLNNGGYPGARSVRAGAVAARLVGCQRVVMVVNNIAYPYSTVGRIVDFPLDLLVRHCTDTFVTASASSREALISVLSLEPSVVVQIPNAVTQPAISTDRGLVRASVGATDETIVIGLVGLLEERKGHAPLIAAVARLFEMDPSLRTNVRIWLVGDGPLLPGLRSKVHELGLEENFTFFGYLQDYLQVVNAMDIVVAPSLSQEDSPLATLEAMSLAIPVVASSLAGLSEQVIHADTGYLVEPGDDTALALRLLDLIGSESKRKDFGARGLQRYSSQYSPEALIKSYTRLYSAE